MNEPHHKQHELGPEPAAIDVAAGHEMSDVSIRGLVTFLTGLVVSLAVVVFAVAWFFSFLTSEAEQEDPPPPPLSGLRSKEPPLPRLQEAPALDMRSMRNAQDEVLEKEEWIPEEQGVKRIPIEKAIDLVVRRGLPKWPPVKDEDAKSVKGKSEIKTDTPEDRQ